jgi:uncharacterized protein
VGPTRDLVSQMAWKMRPQSGIGLEEVVIGDGRYMVVSKGSSVRCLAFFRVGVTDSTDDSKVDYSAALRTTLQQQRIKGLFEGLRRAGVPFVYMMLMDHSEDGGDAPQILEFDLVVGTWVDAKKKEDIAATLEQRASILSATLTVALPNANVVRLMRKELADFMKSALLPGGRVFPQSGSPATAGALCTFNDMSPLAATVDRAPEFYIPNATESGQGGILLGSVRSAGRGFHDFRLLLEDLKRHVSILGATGSGKSTTASLIVKQVAEAGLPILVLDWHSEFASVVADVGGKVVVPGKDDFTVNPLEVDRGVDPAEHIASVSDIFSDVYHFTHPQAYMFRNALQKRLSECASDEVPTIEGLVRTIEGYPLRSAYDNETKVALLRRLVPLKEGQAGKALGGSSPLKLDELLRAVVCVELGHLRDIQSRAVFCDVMLKMIYEEKTKQKGPMDHVTVIEEARNIAPARRPEDPPTVGERMISELRKFGESMVFVAQFPSHVAAEVVKNSGTKIVHRLAWPDDVALIGDSVGLNQKQRVYLTRLKVGEAVVSVGRVSSPVLVQVYADQAQAGGSRDLSFPPES